MGDHDREQLFVAMREHAVNPRVRDEELWNEWKEHGKPSYRDVSGNCICGVAIKWEHMMINIHNGTIIGPVGNVCILNALRNRYRCEFCDKQFIKLKRNNMSERIKTGNWTCNPCKRFLRKRHDHRMDDEEHIIWIWTQKKLDSFMTERKKYYQSLGISVEDEVPSA